MPDYIMDIPDDVILLSQELERRRCLIRLPANYAGELDILLRTPASGRVYKPEGLSVTVADGFESIMETMVRAGMRNHNELAELEKYYKRAGMPSVSQARTYILLEWTDLKPVGDAPSGVRPSQYIDTPREVFAGLYTLPPVTGHICAGTFNYRAAPLRIVETTREGHATGWEARANIIENGTWNGTLRKLPAAFVIASGFNNVGEAIEMTRNRHFLRGRTLDYDSRITAILFEPSDAKNITFRPANDSIITINAAPKRGQVEHKLSL